MFDEFPNLRIILTYILTIYPIIELRKFSNSFDHGTNSQRLLPGSYRSHHGSAASVDGCPTTQPDWWCHFGQDLWWPSPPAPGRCLSGGGWGGTWLESHCFLELSHWCQEKMRGSQLFATPQHGFLREQLQNRFLTPKYRRFCQIFPPTNSGSF